MQQKKNSFSGSIGFVLAAAGSAVGVGNIWRFPYLCAKDGGGLFLIIYLVLVLTFGFVLLTTDIAIGRKTNKNGPRGGVGTIIADAITYSPTLKLKDEEGNWLRDNINSTKDNPYGRLTQDLDESYTNYLAANLQFMVQSPVKGLSLNFQGAAHYKPGRL